jgi:hypothetical protein
MAKTNRREDTRLEGIVNEFLDCYFFKDFDEVKWVSDKETQLKGIDIFLTDEEHNLDVAKVDIKSAVKYSNRYLGTFSLELSFLGWHGEERTGWFVNNNLETEYYLFLYPRSEKYYTEMVSKDDIDYIDYYLVKKEDIMKFLISRGYDKERLLDVVKDMRDECIKGGWDKLTRESGSENFHFTLSGRLAEQPVNIVMSRQVYDRYATMKGRITK